MPIDPAANLNDPDIRQIGEDNPPRIPFKIADGDFVASFSGADFLVLGYVPPNPAELGTEVGRTTRNQEEQNRSNFTEFANLQTLSISTTRDVGSKRPLGTSWVESHSLGSRTVAGSLSFLTVDGDALRSFQRQYLSNSRDDATDYLPDLMPPFNIIVSGHNEFGTSISGVIIGAQIINTGTVIGVQDAFTEQTFSYVAQRWIPLRGAREYHQSLRTLFSEREVIQKIIIDAYADPWKWVPPQLKSFDELSQKIKNRQYQELSRRAGEGNSQARNELAQRLIDLQNENNTGNSILDNL